MIDGDGVTNVRFGRTGNVFLPTPFHKHNRKSYTIMKQANQERGDATKHEKAATQRVYRRNNVKKDGCEQQRSDSEGGRCIRDPQEGVDMASTRKDETRSKPPLHTRHGIYHIVNSRDAQVQKKKRKKRMKAKQTDENSAIKDQARAPPKTALLL